MADKVPVWLDCDPGHDDVFAILLVTSHPALNCLGISTIHGNASLDHVTENACRVLTAFNRPDVAVFPGKPRPYCRIPSYAPGIHGKSGLDGTDLLPPAGISPRSKENAILAMRNALMAQARGTAWLVATGSTTNVALLFATFPEVAEHIRGFTLMGGSIGGGFTNAPLGRVQGQGERFGNHSPWAEFNIYSDPESAQSLFLNAELAAKTTIIPLDVTHLVLGTKPVLELLLCGPPERHDPNPSTLRIMLHDLLLFFADRYADVFGLVDGPPLHDPVAVAVILDDLGIEKIAFDYKGGERFAVNVVTDGLHSEDDSLKGQVGRTVATKLEPGQPGIRIPRGLDVKRFWGVVEECLEKAEARTKLA